MTNQAEKLLSIYREGYLDNYFLGSVYLAKENKIYKQLGFNDDTICFMRSLAKPFQASIICDYDFIKEFKLTQKELAIFMASHSGSPLHIEVLKNLLKKFKLKINNLEIEKDYPLDMKGFRGVKTKLHNNCSAKHIMMIAISNYLGYPIKNYMDINHPIQKLIYKKQVELTNYKSSIITKDGCGTPLWGLDIKSIINGYFNFLNNEKYSPLYKSALKHPYIFGGNNRLDSEIIQLSKGKLFSKVGAGGFVIVYNFELNEILLIKMIQNNNEYRRLITLDILNKINWLDYESENWVYNQKKEKVAKYYYKFQL